MYLGSPSVALGSLPIPGSPTSNLGGVPVRPRACTLEKDRTREFAVVHSTVYSLSGLVGIGLSLRLVGGVATMG